jgi:hypothetical protein
MEEDTDPSVSCSHLVNVGLKVVYKTELCNTIDGMRSCISATRVEKGSALVRLVELRLVVRCRRMLPSAQDAR